MVASLLYIMYASFKASTHSVVLVFYIANRALLFIFLFYYHWMCPFSVCLHYIYFVNQLYLLYYILINFRLQYEGTLKYLGESDTGLEFGIWKWWHGSCIAVGNSQQGCWQVCRQISVDLLHICRAFPMEKGGQMILTSFSDVTTAWLVH